jgi:hypothetical protein
MADRGRLMGVIGKLPTAPPDLCFSVRDGTAFHRWGSGPQSKSLKRGAKLE